MTGARDDFAIAAPAWRVRRLRGRLSAAQEAGGAARGAGEPRTSPAEIAHRAEVRRWFAGWDRAAAQAELAPSAAKPPTARQLARLARWQSGAGRLRPAEGARRRDILDDVADELLGAKPLAFGAIAAAHRETVRRCRAAGVPAPKASRYRRWLKLTGRIQTPAVGSAKDSPPSAEG